MPFCWRCHDPIRLSINTKTVSFLVPTIRFPRYIAIKLQIVFILQVLKNEAIKRDDKLRHVSLGSDHPAWKSWVSFFTWRTSLALSLLVNMDVCFLHGFLKPYKHHFKGSQIGRQGGGGFNNQYGTIATSKWRILCGANDFFLWIHSSISFQRFISTSFAMCQVDATNIQKQFYQVAYKKWYSTLSVWGTDL